MNYALTVVNSLKPKMCSDEKIIFLQYKLIIILFVDVKSPHSGQK